MSDLFHAAVWLFAAGYWGFVLGKHRNERSHRNDLPQWKAALGDALVGQMKSVADGHRFVGDDMHVQNRQSYTGRYGRMLVTVERAEVEA